MYKPSDSSFLVNGHKIDEVTVKLRQKIKNSFKLVLLKAGLCDLFTKKHSFLKNNV